MTSIKIEKGVPLPPRSSTGITEAMRSMEVGDSFTVPLVGSIRSIVVIVSKRLGISIATRTESDSLRVWRTA